MMELFLSEFASVYDKEKLSIVSAGAGFSMAQLLSVAGTSRIISGIYLPYDTAETEEFLCQNIGHAESLKFTEKTVCKEAAELLFRGLKIRNASLENVRNIAITGAIQTNRYRRGDNHAFISLEKNHEIETWHIMLPKIEENDFLTNTSEVIAQKVYETRKWNDLEIAFVALMLVEPNGLNEYFYQTFEALKNNGSLRRL